ncbi:MAG: FAD-dependent oxidoreductase [Bryobacterales bacterium]|nr:FAD-dependent oxidoreductase [Bryobacterales bacterium]
MRKASNLLLAVACLLPAAMAQTREYEVVDVQSVRAEGDPSRWIHTVRAPANPAEIACDILVAGGGMGGVAAALRAASRGHSVCLTEATDWLGGQATAGGVSALDENRFIEFAGGTRSYYEFRRRIRDHYRTAYRLSPAAAGLEDLNPGACYVSPLCFEPAVGVRALDAMLAPARDRVQVFPRSEVIDLEVREGAIRAALVYQFEKKQVLKIRPRFVLDATELGDLLPLARIPYVAGSEARSETGEPHAGEKPNAGCVQSFTYPFAIEHRPGESHRIPKPPEYEKFRDGQPFSLRIYYPVDLGWKGHVQYTMFGDDPPIPNNQSPRPFFSWRRLLAGGNFAPGGPAELALINWPRQDYHSESLLDRTAADTARVLQQAKRVSLAFLYWLQTDLPRDDGKGNGYPELRLRADAMGSQDGLSKYPYIRESRRIRARGRVVEQDIVAEHQPGARARWFADSIGTGFYMVDIHPCGTGERGRMMMPRPFQIPMGAMLPQGVTNFLPAGKNLGVTHVTNGAFRLHPVEWNVGEAAAVMASLALNTGAIPEAWAVQRELARAGVPLVWFDDLRTEHPAFAAIHLAAIRGAYPLNDHDLHASPDAPATRAEAAQALAAFFGHSGMRPEAAVSLALEKGWMAADHRNWFHPSLPFYWSDWREDKFPAPLPPLEMKRRGPVTRAELALRLAGAWR